MQELVARVYNYPTIERAFRVIVEFRNEPNFFERFKHYSTETETHEKPKFVEIEMSEADRLGVDYDVRKSMYENFKFSNTEKPVGQLCLSF